MPSFARLRLSAPHSTAVLAVSPRLASVRPAIAYPFSPANAQPSIPFILLSSSPNLAVVLVAGSPVLKLQDLGGAQGCKPASCLILKGQVKISVDRRKTQDFVKDPVENRSSYKTPEARNLKIQAGTAVAPQDPRFGSRRRRETAQDLQMRQAQTVKTRQDSGFNIRVKFFETLGLFSKFRRVKTQDSIFESRSQLRNSAQVSRHLRKQDHKRFKGQWETPQVPRCLKPSIRFKIRPRFKPTGSGRDHSRPTTAGESSLETALIQVEYAEI
ncbi:hypothetical protein C8R46DRAFT_1247037 [Mycena filopes]|nr:hypothetical protein C8R46DRAFT_1247037 [Mycena filopes]